MIGSEGPDANFLPDFREARLAIEPTASGFAALNASAENLNAMECCLERYESSSVRVHGPCAVDLGLGFPLRGGRRQRDPLLAVQLSDSIREPFRTFSSRYPANFQLGLEARALVEALQ